MPPKVPNSESGMATLGMRVAGALRRKTNTTRTTSRLARRRVTFTSRKEARMVVERSSTTVSLIAGGMAACSSGKSALTRSTVSIMLAPGWR